MSSKTGTLLTFSILIIIFIFENHLILGRTKTYYILHWVKKNLKRDPFLYVGPGSSQFVRYNCTYTNCFVTKNRHIFRAITKFDAILFDALDLFWIRHPNKYLPPKKERSPQQKYIFTSVESPSNFPVCHSFYNDYFNWTWTYRLESDIRRGYLTAYDFKGKVVAPRKNKKWGHMKPINEELKSMLRKKTELAAWFVSNCESKDGRRIFINKVQEVLTSLGGHTVDIFGRCGKFSCPHGASKCARMLKRDYFFYMAFENSFSKDYITEKVLTALNNYNVPVVYGAANYNRILPPGSYLNARELGPESLARRMVELKNNISAYFDFFRWRNHITYKETTYTDDTCFLCTLMNNGKKRKEQSSVKKFTAWWNEGICPH